MAAHDQERKPRYACCICQQDAVTDSHHTCADCRDIFMVAEGDQAKEAAAQRTAVGPTDI